MDGIAASSHVTNTSPGLVMEDTVALERIKHMVRDAYVMCHLATSAQSLPYSVRMARRRKRSLSSRQLSAVPHKRRVQASAKWRIVWRLAPRLLERWSEAGRLNAINAAVTETTHQVCGCRCCSSHVSTGSRLLHVRCLPDRFTAVMPATC